jgi:hypothetical protein
MRRGLVCGLSCLLACGPGLPAGDAGGEASSGATSTASAGTATGTEAPTTGGTTTSGEASSSGVASSGGEVSSSGSVEQTFIVMDDFEGIVGIVECDNWQQDCPPGEKCAAWANDGGSAWNSLKCVPVAEDPKQPGDACTVEGSGVSGVDDCDVGVMCWDIDDMNMGTCVPLCTGSPDAPMCEDPTRTCAVANEGVLNLCLPSCDPLAQDCPGGDLCIGNPSGDGFLCVLDASGEEGQQHDACEFANACDAGLLCLPATAANECDPAASGCCEPFCDLTDPDADASCGGAGQVCNPYFEEGTAPPGQDDLGYCALPM